jgi:hypothetical protein
MYIFNENMNAKLLQGILGTHLVESAELHFDTDNAEQWWFLQDNACNRPLFPFILSLSFLFDRTPQHRPHLSPLM